MKKRIYVAMLGLCLALGLAGCGKSGLTGTYAGADGETYTFKDDGTFVSADKSGLSVSGTYEKLDDGSYSIFIDGGFLSASGTFVIENNVLKVTVGGNTREYTKQ
ncbi:MAG: hypothetical protein IJ716_01505 [Lachnospiraceae bacterium]|nr:hypothetical protein [Lachnospiraceae bacterium]